MKCSIIHWQFMIEIMEKVEKSFKESIESD